VIGQDSQRTKIEAWCDLNDADLVEVFKDAMCGDLAEQRR